MSPSVEPGWEDGWYLWIHPKQNPVWHLGCWVRGWLLWTLSRPVTPGTQGVGTGHSVEQGKHMLLMAFAMHQIRDPFFVDSSRNAPMWKKYKAKRNQNYHEIRGWGVKNNSFPLTVKKGPGLVNQNVHYYGSWKILGTICLWLSTSFIFLILEFEAGVGESQWEISTSICRPQPLFLGQSPTKHREAVEKDRSLWEPLGSVCLFPHHLIFSGSLILNL